MQTSVLLSQRKVLSLCEGGWGPSGRRGPVNISQRQVEGVRHLAATRARRVQEDQTGQQGQSCSQEDVEEAWVEQGGGREGGGGGPAAGGGTVEEEEVEVLVSGLPAEPQHVEKLWRRREQLPRPSRLSAPLFSTCC